MRTSLLILALLLAGTALPFWWSPYSASGQLAVALEERDAVVLNRSVDLERLQRLVAYHVRTSHSIQRNPTLEPTHQQAFDALVADSMRQEVERRTRHSEILQLLRRALGEDSHGTRFMRARQLMARDALEWRDLNSVYVGSPQQTRLLMIRSGLVWRVAGLQFPEPELRLELVERAAGDAR